MTLLFLKHALLTVIFMLPEGEEDDFIREAATESVRVHPLSLFRCGRSIMHRPMSEQKGVAILSGLHSPAPETVDNGQGNHHIGISLELSLHRRVYWLTSDCVSGDIGISRQLP